MVQCDGEVLGKGLLRITIIPRAINVIVPGKDKVMIRE
jgi:diacylglycerol kinase family enzyme